MPSQNTCLLASSSPRRRALLAAVGFDITLVSAHTDEHWPALAPGPAAEALAKDKLRAAQAKHRAALDPNGTALWVAADTVVVLEGQVFGKPHDAKSAKAMLRALRGQTHEVVTGFVVARGEAERVAHAKSLVTMRPYSDAEITAYAESGEALDKSGAYAIQGGGTVLSARIEGSLSNIVGLPVAEVMAAIAELDAATR